MGVVVETMEELGRQWTVVEAVVAAVVAVDKGCILHKHLAIDQGML